MREFELKYKSKCTKFECQMYDELKKTGLIELFAQKNISDYDVAAIITVAQKLAKKSGISGFTDGVINTTDDMSNVDADDYVNGLNEYLNENFNGHRSYIDNPHSTHTKSIK